MGDPVPHGGGQLVSLPQETTPPDLPKKVVHTFELPAKPGPTTLDQLSDDDRAALKRIAAGARTVVDVGTFLGGSAEAMLSGMPPDGHLYTIDNYRGMRGFVTGQVPAPLMLLYALQRLEPDAHRVTFMVGQSRDCAGQMQRGFADLVFLDAAHDYENVKADIEAWLPVVKPNGLLVGHDLDRKAAKRMEPEDIARLKHTEWDRESGLHCGVICAVQESFSQIMLAEEEHSSVWAVRPEWKL